MKDPGTQSTPRSWCEYDVDSLSANLRLWGFPQLHARAILQSWYATGGSADRAAGRIGPRLLKVLAERVGPVGSTIMRRHVSDDGTVKQLIRFATGGMTEAVLMPAYQPGRAMACVSSQIGCAMGCDFCASTKNGLERDLSFGEIVEQFVHLASVAREGGRRISSLVFMGMGEPMMNLENVISAIKRIADPDMGGVGWRQVTVSTVGIVPGIDRLAAEDLNVHLALSLHAADDETRTSIVPMNRKYSIDEILSAAKRFYDRSGRIVTIEWCLIDGINDSDAQADKLAALLRDRGMLRAARVNVIPYNPIGTSLRGANYQPPTPLRTKLFVERLQLANVVAHPRGPRGDDVSAACGQLRRV